MNDVKIIEPISKYTKEFDTVDEFNLYYNKHKNDMDSLTTHKLNKMYYIKGYHITKIKNVLMLKKIKEENSIIEQKNIEISELKQEIKQIKETINNIIHFLNSNNQVDSNCYADSYKVSDVSPPSDT